MAENDEAGWVYLGIGAAVALMITVLIVTFFLLSKRKERRGTFALTGICNAGKTAFFHQLRQGKLVMSHTSLKVNEGTFPLFSEINSPSAARAKQKPIRLVDLPGHEKLRFLFSKYEKELGGIVFVIDAAEFHQEHRQVAEYLYDILSSDGVIKHKVPVLVACNKMDIPTAQPKDRIQSQLESEFNQLRMTRAAAPQRQADDQTSGGGVVFLGYENKPFSFDHLENELQFVECTVVKDFEPVEQFIRAIYPL